MSKAWATTSLTVCQAGRAEPGWAGLGWAGLGWTGSTGAARAAHIGCCRCSCAVHRAEVLVCLTCPGLHGVVYSAAPPRSPLQYRRSARPTSGRPRRSAGALAAQPRSAHAQSPAQRAQPQRRCCAQAGAAACAVWACLVKALPVAGARVAPLQRADAQPADLEVAGTQADQGLCRATHSAGCAPATVRREHRLTCCRGSTPAAWPPAWPVRLRHQPGALQQAGAGRCRGERHYRSYARRRLWPDATGCLVPLCWAACNFWLST